jgi:hypothetical protein
MPRAAKPKSPAPLATIERVIRDLRGERVILDADLAKIYGVETRTLNQALRRNREKFPPDFMFELTHTEAVSLQRARAQPDAELRSQIVILKRGQHIKHLPFAFTEHGAIMAANILSSPQAVQMSVFVVRAFIKMRSALTDTRDLARKLAALEKDLTSRLDTHETALVEVLQRILALLEPPPPPPEPPRREIGFHAALKSPAAKPA